MVPAGTISEPSVGVTENAVPEQVTANVSAIVGIGFTVTVTSNDAPVQPSPETGVTE